MIVDLREKGDIPPAGFIRVRRLDEVAARLLNVAVSRAKQHVTVIADRTHLEGCSPQNGI